MASLRLRLASLPVNLSFIAYFAMAMSHLWIVRVRLLERLWTCLFRLPELIYEAYLLARCSYECASAPSRGIQTSESLGIFAVPVSETMRTCPAHGWTGTYCRRRLFGKLIVVALTYHLHGQLLGPLGAVAPILSSVGDNRDEQALAQASAVCSGHKSQGNADFVVCRDKQDVLPNTQTRISGEMICRLTA